MSADRQSGLAYLLVYEARSNAGGEVGGMKSYVYEIRVNEVVRYVGKGRNGRVYSHMIEAKRTEKRCGVNTDHLYPYFNRKLVEAIRRGSTVTEKIIISDLTDEDAYRIEKQMIGKLHKLSPGQLWNTIDERFLDPEYLPEEWDNPVHPLYKLPRPLTRNVLDND
jgi:hypothetical protein